MTAANAGPITDSALLSKRLKNLENVAEVETAALEHAVVSFDSSTSYALLSAADGDRVLVGKQLAERLGVIPAKRSRSSRSAINRRFESPSTEFSRLACRISTRRESTFRGTNSRRSIGNVLHPRTLNLKLNDIYKSPETSAVVRGALGSGFRVSDWQESNRPLFAALSLERRVIAAIIALIFLIAALNVTTTLALLVNERRFDIGVLRACGASSRSLIAVFLIEGALLGVVGIVAGTLLGLAACALGNYFRLVSISAEVYSLNYVPFHPNGISIVFIIVCAFLAVLVASLFPAMRAGRVTPADNLRAH
ncbi:MAG: ABC transporter permease [Acidobacteria bacterium]|nr:ABC transporter permease [Acidobacteriota bacterium]